MKIADLPIELQQQHRDRQQRERLMAKAFIEACTSGDVEQFEAVIGGLDDNGAWQPAYRLLAKSGLSSVSQDIKECFQLHWFQSRSASRCDDVHALTDALYVLFTPYKGSAVRLFRGATAHEARARKLYRQSWTTDIEEADWFARWYQAATNGTVVLETLAPPQAIISAPGVNGAHWLNNDGSRRYDEREYIADGRRLTHVTVARRYPQISFEEWTAREDGKLNGHKP